jgi:CheY-like chemotaxis protein
MIELKKILLVDDNPNDVELTLEALAEHNLINSVEVARDGEEALEYLYRRGKFASRTEGDPVVILLDLKLPKVDGHEVLRKIRADEKIKLVPVVVLTSSREERDLAQGQKNGANAYVVKPVDFHEFLDAMKTIGLFWAVLNEAPPSARQT